MDNQQPSIWTIIRQFCQYTIQNNYDIIFQIKVQRLSHMRVGSSESEKVYIHIYCG